MIRKPVKVAALGIILGLLAALFIGNAKHRPRDSTALDFTSIRPIAAPL